MDYAASTPIEPSVRREIDKAAGLYGNPSSFNDMGRLARNKLEESRQSVARFLGAKTDEIIFTASGSEANSLAILGLANKQSKPGEIITTPIEHLSVLEPLRVLEKRGWKITYLKVNLEGLVDLNDLKKKLNPRVRLVSIIYANNEIGTIQPILKISKLIRSFGVTNRPLFHVDACQAAGYLEMNVNNLGADLMTFNSSKIYGPRGIAVLYKKSGIGLAPLILGGNQEHGFRAGTENLPTIAGLAAAIKLINKNESEKTTRLRDYFFDNIFKVLPDIKINGPVGNLRLANNINISIPGISDEQLLLELDKYGIYASSGSACTSHSVEPSHVLKAIGVEKKYLSGALRLSLGRQTTKKEIDYALEILPKAVADLRKRYKII